MMKPVVNEKQFIERLLDGDNGFVLRQVRNRPVIFGQESKEFSGIRVEIIGFVRITHCKYAEILASTR
jgi:hypothetical protein